MPTARIEWSVAYPSYIWWACIPVISVTHTRCGKDPADIPKKGKDSTTSPVRQRKISKNTSHVMQEAIIIGDDITKSIVLTMVLKIIIPANWQGDIIKPCLLLVRLASAMSSLQLQTLGICHMCADSGQKTRRDNVKNIALIASMVIRRIKDMCGQVISVGYPNKENHDLKRMRLTAKVWWFLHDHQGPDT